MNGIITDLRNIYLKQKIFSFFFICTLVNLIYCLMQGALDTFLSESIKVDEDVAINVALTFTDTVKLENLTVATLNGIDKNLIVLTGTEDMQTIHQNLTLPQSELVIEGEVEVTLLNDLSPNLFNDDVLRLDREETIVNTPLHFQGQVVLTAENVTITGIRFCVNILW